MAVAKKAVAIFLMITLMSTDLSRFFVYFGFELNHKYIAKELCINRNRPWMHCNGSCYLMKKISEAREKEKKQARESEKNHFQEGLPATLRLQACQDFVAPASRTNPRSLATHTLKLAHAVLVPPPKTIAYFLG